MLVAILQESRQRCANSFADNGVHRLAVKVRLTGGLYCIQCGCGLVDRHRWHHSTAQSV